MAQTQSWLARRVSRPTSHLGNAIAPNPCRSSPGNSFRQNVCSPVNRVGVCVQLCHASVACMWSSQGPGLGLVTLFGPSALGVSASIAHRLRMVTFSLPTCIGSFQIIVMNGQVTRFCICTRQPLAARPDQAWWLNALFDVATQASLKPQIYIISSFVPSRLYL